MTLAETQDVRARVARALEALEGGEPIYCASIIEDLEVELEAIVARTIEGSA